MRAALRPPLGTDVLVGGLLAVLAGLLLAPAFVAAGSEFDEGILVAFPTIPGLSAGVLAPDGVSPADPGEWTQTVLLVWMVLSFVVALRVFRWR